ncbi:MAG: hypothetical protein IT385_24655 [Deltaproteobacteria bacterium]|nr:hypothetical protein [Deltaproteobacteria bacterium]
MRRTIFALATLALGTLGTIPAHATVEGFIQYTVPYKSVQTDDICFMRLPMLAQFGIPQAAVTVASLTPTAILKNFPTPQFVNINLAAPTKRMVHTYVSDAITSTGVWEYTMKLDVSALSTANGTTLAGRTSTIKSAKLALLAIARNMDDLSDGNYRLRVTFTGLPSQTGVVGTKLYATTQYAYTATSPLLVAYENELIDVEGSCPAEL